MAILPIVKYPDKILTTPCINVEPNEFDSYHLLKLVQDMKDTLIDINGYAIAANQVGVNKRICVIMYERHGTLINPEIDILDDNPYTYKEGCLSVPDIFTNIERPSCVLVKAYKPSGEYIEFTAANLFATIIQHEVDHLNGVMFFDKMGPVRKELALNKFRKMRK